MAYAQLERAESKLSQLQQQQQQSSPPESPVPDDVSAAVADDEDLQQALADAQHALTVEKERHQATQAALDAVGVRGVSTAHAAL